MTEEEKRNLAAAERWARLYNEDVHRMVDECYAADAEIHVVGQMSFRSGETFHRAEENVLKAAPRRIAHVERTIARGDTVVVEAVLRDPDRGGGWQTSWCAILTFRDGKIVLDHTYLDHTVWPGFRAPRAAN
jgi:ketosteroid isomerase-like protein